MNVTRHVLRFLSGSALLVAASTVPLKGDGVFWVVGIGAVGANTLAAWGLRRMNLAGFVIMFWQYMFSAVVAFPNGIGAAHVGISALILIKAVALTMILQTWRISTELAQNLDPNGLAESPRRRPEHNR